MQADWGDTMHSFKRGVFLVLALVLVITSMATGVRGDGDASLEFRCNLEICRGSAGCSGEYYDRDGCHITCYVNGGSGAYVWSGEADCGPVIQ
jgi:hypothetical protein